MRSKRLCLFRVGPTAIAPATLPVALQLLLLVGMIFAGSGAHAAETKQPANAHVGAPPKIMVLLPGELPSANVRKNHRRLVKALRRIFGTRVVGTKATFAAIKKTKVLIATLETPASLKQLGAEINAPRAIVLNEVKRGHLEVNVYGRLDAGPSLVLNAKGRLKRLRRSEARHIANLIKQRAALILKALPEEAAASAAPEDGFTFEVGPVDTKETGKTAGGLAESGLSSVEAGSDEKRARASSERSNDVSGGVAEEMAREQAQRREHAIPPRPLLEASIGLATGFRQLRATGPLVAHLIPIRTGAVVGLQGAVRLRPLQIFPKLNRSRWSLLWVDVRARRALTVSQYQGTDVCAVDDDDGQLQVGYRVPILASAWAPQLGAAAAVGWERTAFRCALDVLSTVYPYAGVDLVAVQPLLPKRVVLELTVQSRYVLHRQEERLLSPPLGGSMSVRVFLPPLFFLRAGARLSQTTLALDNVVTTLDRRLVLYAELGGAF